MKFKMILPVVAAIAMFQLVPQAALSQCSWHGGGYGNNYGISRHEARHMWRAEHYGYGAYAPPVYNYGYNNNYGYRGGLLGGVARAIF